MEKSIDHLVDTESSRLPSIERLRNLSTSIGVASRGVDYKDIEQCDFYYTVGDGSR